MDTTLLDQHLLVTGEGKTIFIFNIKDAVEENGEAYKLKDDLLVLDFDKLLLELGFGRTEEEALATVEMLLEERSHGGLKEFA